MAALSVERASEGKAIGSPRRSASAWNRRRSSLLAATPPETTILWAPRDSAAAKVWRSRLPTTAYLERGEEVERLLIAKRYRGWGFRRKRRIGGQSDASGLDALAHVMRLDVPEDSGLDAAEGEVEVRALGVSGSFFVRDAFAWRTAFDFAETERHCARIAVRSERIDPRTTGIAEAEQLGHLVVSLAGSVVDGTAHVAIGPCACASLPRKVQMRVTAGDDEREQRKLHGRAVALPGLHQHRMDVAFEMVD